MKQRVLVRTLPFYNQLMTEDNWQEEHFPSLQEAESWSARGCGIASLRMVLDGFGIGCGKQGDMIREGVAAEAYSPGVGWIHWGLAHMAEAYGLYAEAKREQSVEDLKRFLAEDCVVIVSITPAFLYGQKRPDGSLYTKGGHLVPVYGYTEENGVLQSFLLHHCSIYEERIHESWEVPLTEFAPSFSGNLIVFSDHPLLGAEA